MVNQIAENALLRYMQRQFSVVLGSTVKKCDFDRQFSDDLCMFAQFCSERLLFTMIIPSYIEHLTHTDLEYVCLMHAV